MKFKQFMPWIADFLNFESAEIGKEEPVKKSKEERKTEEKKIKRMRIFYSTF